MSRGFGIPAIEDEGLIKALSKEIEALGYATFWTNDTPAADGLEVASWALEATEHIRVGIGVVALDRRAPPSFADHLRNLDSERLLLGVGAGFSDKPLRTAREGIAELRQLAPEFRISLGAMGPKMCRLAGETADAVLLNWMTPQRIEWARGRLEEGEADGGGPTEVGAYVRVALDDASGKAPGVAAERLAKEVGRYASMPHYERHFASMGVSPADVGLAGDPSGVSKGMKTYEDPTDEVVARALPADYELEQLLRIARVAAPS